ncbi:hypothetical protein FEP46_02770 [Burkholderia multivorans]|nr:hypothetical protein [Burkholderia multivorans]
MNRRTRICDGLLAHAVASVAAPNSASPIMIAGRRPMRSPTRPSVIAPIVMPTIPAVRIGASAPDGNANDARIAGPVKAIACVSKPSSSAISTHSASTRIWNAPSGASSIHAGIERVAEAVIEGSLLSPGATTARFVFVRRGRMPSPHSARQHRHGLDLDDIARRAAEHVRADRRPRGQRIGGEVAVAHLHEQRQIAHVGMECG